MNQNESEKAAESAAEESNIITMGGGRETIASEPDTQTPDNPVDTSNPDDPPESYKPPEITIPDPNDKYPNNAGYQFTGGLNKDGDGYYKGVTANELLERFDGSYGVNLTKHWNTPLGIYFQIQSKYACYNKLTGNFSPMCPDPLCRHTDCIWGQIDLHFLYVNDTHIYFFSGDFISDPTLYRCDMNRNMAVGFDTWAAEEILEAEKTHPSVKTECAIPFPQQDRKWPKAHKLRRKEITERADEITVVCDRYHRRCFFARNRCTVDQADSVLGCFDVQSGGTAETVKYARKIEKMELDNAHTAVIQIKNSF